MKDLDSDSPFFKLNYTFFDCCEICLSVNWYIKSRFVGLVEKSFAVFSLIAVNKFFAEKMRGSTVSVRINILKHLNLLSWCLRIRQEKNEMP